MSKRKRAFTKSQLRRQVEHKRIDEEISTTVEVIDLHIQYEIAPGEQLQVALTEIIGEVSEKFGEMIERDKKVLPARLAEAERWKNVRLFDDLNT